MIASDRIAGTNPYLVSHGKSGIVGAFVPVEPIALARRCPVIVRTDRGVEMGNVLALAGARQAQRIGAQASGIILRAASAADHAKQADLRHTERRLFERCRTHAAELGFGLEILDVDLLFDGVNAVVQFVGADSDAEAFARALEQQVALTVRVENLALPAASEEREHEHGCGKPDCGKADGDGGCTTCSTGGGCSSCGAGKVDLRDYFSHLRTKMETGGRIPLA